MINNQNRTKQFLKNLGNGKSLPEIEAEESFLEEKEFGKEDQENDNN